MASAFQIHIRFLPLASSQFSCLSSSFAFCKSSQNLRLLNLKKRGCRFRRQSLRFNSVTASLPALDLTEDNINQVLIDARSELGSIFDTSIGLTGQVELAELDGPYVTLRLKGKFWHTRANVLARVGNYLKIRIPEILEVEIEDEKQLDDSPANF